jgi:hypothetical protein
MVFVAIREQFRITTYVSVYEVLKLKAKTVESILTFCVTGVDFEGVLEENFDSFRFNHVCA